VLDSDGVYIIARETVLWSGSTIYVGFITAYCNSMIRADQRASENCQLDKPTLMSNALCVIISRGRNPRESSFQRQGGLGDNVGGVTSLSAVFNHFGSDVSACCKFCHGFSVLGLREITVSRCGRRVVKGGSDVDELLQVRKE
jgi:hypothetical protein